MNPKITLLMALAAFAISAASANYGSSYGPINSEKSSKAISVASQSATNDYSKESSNTNRGYNTNSKVDIDEAKTAQKESRVPPPPPPPKVVYVPEPKYKPAPKSDDESYLL